jgi:hypothetical protein
MTRSVAVGQDDISLVLRLLDDSTGAPVESIPSPGPTVWYRREGAAVVTDSGSAAELTALTTAHTDWEYKHIRDGYWRVDYPDAAFAAAAGGVLCGIDATGLSCVAEYINIDPSIKFQGKVDAATATTTTFVNGIIVYTGDLIYVIDGTGFGQTRLITGVAPESSPGAGTVATHAAWDVNISTTTSTVLLVPGDETLADGGINVDTTVSSRSSHTAADINVEIDTALTDIHLDHLFAADYDPASKPGVATALLNELIENDAGVSRYTANALEQAGSGASAQAVWDEVLDSTHTVAGSAAEKLKTITGSDGAELSTTAVTDIWETVLTEGYATVNTAGTASQILYTIQQFLTDADLSGTTMTIRQVDGTSAAYVIALNSATIPTDKNRTS